MSTDNDYEIAITEVLKTEGGYVNDPSDSGGETNLGITLKFELSEDDLELMDVNGDGVLNSEDIKKLTPERAAAIYRKYFWDAYNLNNINSGKIAYLMFDMIINHGPGIIKRIKTVLSKMVTVPIDTSTTEIGDDVVDAINGIDVDSFTANLIQSRKDFYTIISKKGNNIKFLRGWMNRCEQNRANLDKFEN